MPSILTFRTWLRLLQHARRLLNHSLTRRAFINISIASAAGALVLTSGKSHADVTVPGTTPNNAGILWADFWGKIPPTIRTDSDVQLTLDPSRALIAFEGKLELNEVQQLLGQVGHDLRVENVGKGKLLHGALRLGLRINHLPNQVWVRSQSKQPISPKTITAIGQAFNSDLKPLQWVGPAYRYPHTADQVGVVCALPNVISILPRKGIDSASLDAILLHKFNLLLAQKLTQYLAGYRYYYLPTATLFLPTQSTIYDIHRQVSENPSFKKLVAQANFDYLPLISPAQASFSPVDPLYINDGQWNLNKIQAKEGWESGTLPVLGEGVVVAVIDDTGVEYNHPDFGSQPPTFVQGATFSGGAPPNINENPISSPPAGGEADTDYHGTASAGVIAARYNTIGTAGLAGHCQLMSLRVMGYQAHLVAAAINYASGEGAETSIGTERPSSQANVISMSFVDEPTSGNSLSADAIKTALEKAFDTHHVVLCGSAGNSGHTPPRYPAADSHVIACGASNEADDRCHQADWGSAYGGELSVVAPGESIPTTDLFGNMGDSNGNYLLSFSGTSAAAPHVAGLAALLMSRYPSLKDNPDSVRSIIERTTEKVGHVTLGPGTQPPPELIYTYTTGKPRGDWNQETGYGRINVKRALTFADTMIRKHPSDTGLEPFTPPGNDFSHSDIVLSTADDVTLTNFDSRTGPSFKALSTAPRTS